ncbi:hypothetical protein OAL23_00575 [bacterium]|nr:hypothetical protein [bacterium]MDC0302641.1 hypothetical protein [bacterium]
MNDHVRVSLPEFLNQEKSIRCQLTLMFPIFSLVVLAGVVGSEGDDGDIRLEIQGLLEVGSFEEWSVGITEDAERRSRESFYEVVLAQEDSKFCRVAIRGNGLGSGPERD